MKPELRTSLTVAEWPREVRYFWSLLWGYLDDYGRGVDEPRLIKADCFPLDDDLSASDIDKWLDLIATSRCDGEPASVCRYQSGGKKYIHAPKWSDHQKPQHPRDSRIPPCSRRDCGNARTDLHDDPMTHSGELHEDLCKPPESLSGNGISNTPSPTSVVVPGKGEGEGKGAGEKEAGDAERRDDVERLCAHLADRIIANGSKKPTVTAKWRDAARLLIDKDGRTEEQIHRAIDWCQDSEFWRGNIESMPKLREKYDQLRLQAERDRASPRNGRHQRFSNPENDDALGFGYDE